MKTIRIMKELEKEIEKDIIETLVNYHEIKDVLENTELTPEEKIKHALIIINQLRTKRFNTFPIDDQGKADELDLYHECEANDLEELKLTILHRIMNASSCPFN